MNRLKNITTLFAVSGLLATGCSKQLDLNLDNPNGTDPNKAEAGQVITGALDNTAARVNTGYFFANQWMGYWSRSGGYSAATELETFQLTNSYAQGLWQGMYKNNYDYNFVISKGGAASYLGSIAAIMKVLNIQMLVDTYGNIPYSQASQPQVTIRPKYDTAQAIYRDLVVQLNAAITSIKAATPGGSDATYDIVFKGDKAKWVRFANTPETAHFNAAGTEGRSGLCAGTDCRHFHRRIFTGRRRCDGEPGLQRCYRPAKPAVGCILCSWRRPCRKF